MLKRAILTIGLLAMTDIAAGQSRSVAVLMTYDAENISVPTVELYRQILDDMRESSRFLVIPMSVARDNLITKVPSELGALAAIDRRYLLKAHPPARSYAKAYKRHKNDRMRVISPVQALVDTLAIDGALLLDCETKNKGNLLKGCGLYFYDRARGQIVGSVTKPFQVGIRDARRWSPILVGELGAGISAEQQRREKQSIQRALSPIPQDKDSGQFLAELTAGGHGAAEAGIDFSPAIGLMLGRKFNSYGVGLVVSAGESAREKDAETMRYQERSIGAALTVGSKALADMEWDLGLSLAVAMREMRTLGDNRSQIEADRVLSQKDLKLAMHPGLLWNLTDQTAFGASVVGARYFGVSQSQSADSVGRLRSSTVGLALRLRTLF